MNKLPDLNVKIYDEYKSVDKCKTNDGFQDETVSHGYIIPVLYNTLNLFRFSNKEEQHDWYKKMYNKIHHVDRNEREDI